MVKVTGCSMGPRQFLVAVLGIFLFTTFGASQAIQAQSAMPPPQRPGRVIRVQLGVSPPRSIVSCPVRENFAGYITTNGAAEVRYTWLSSDNSTWPQGTLRFNAAGTQKVSENWTLGVAGQRVGGWVQLKVLSPNTVFSPRAGFGFRCPAR